MPNYFALVDIYELTFVVSSGLAHLTCYVNAVTKKQAVPSCGDRHAFRALMV